MVVLPSGSVTSVAPVSNSSQSSVPATASQDATSERLSSTLRSTTCALRMMIESLPSVISVLSPVAGPPGAAAGGAELTRPGLGAGQAGSANDSRRPNQGTVLLLSPPTRFGGLAYP